MVLIKKNTLLWVLLRILYTFFFGQIELTLIKIIMTIYAQFGKDIHYHKFQNELYNPSVKSIFFLGEPFALASFSKLSPVHPIQFTCYIWNIWMVRRVFAVRLIPFTDIIYTYICDYIFFFCISTTSQPWGLALWTWAGYIFPN